MFGRFDGVMWTYFHVFGVWYSCVDLLGSWVIGFDVFNGAWHGLDCLTWSGRSSVLIGNLVPIMGHIINFPE